MCSCGSLCGALAALLVALYAVGRVMLLPEEGCFLIESFGWPCEEHMATTGDGFKLSLKRVMPKERSKPVLLIHGRFMRHL